MPIEFLDADPEDAWDPDDGVPRLLDNIVRRIVLLVALRALGDHAQQRLELIEADMRHIVERVRAGRLESQHGGGQ